MNQNFPSREHVCVCVFICICRGLTQKEGVGIPGSGICMKNSTGEGKFLACSGIVPVLLRHKVGSIIISSDQFRKMG